VIPLKDHNPTSRAAVVTVLLIVANVAVYFLLQQGRSGSDVVVVDGRPVEIDSNLRFTLESAAIPCEIVEGEPLTIGEAVDTFTNGDQTACDADDTTPELFPGKRVWLAMVVSMFLHGDLLHLGSNMLFLWVFGNNIEDRLGHLRYLGFYLLGGLVATLGHVLVQPSSTVPVVGASGAIAAVMGAYLVWFPAAPVRTVIIFFIVLFRDVPAGVLLAAWFVLQFFTGSDSGVAWVAHVAGFAFGVLVALLVRGNDRARMAMWRGQYGHGPNPWEPQPPDAGWGRY
jgi:membrane associated rhomboid family serine protease